jgi:hypothetical protein
MSHFQPDALTISRGDAWEDRRRFTDAVLSAADADRVAAVSAEEARSLPAELDWDRWNRAVRRVTRRVVLGDGAAEDESLSEMLGELMDKSNPPGNGDSELYGRYGAALQRYVDAAEPGSLVALFDRAPTTQTTRPAGQVTHWLFALGDTLAINALRCLALLAVFQPERDDGEYLRACLQEAMRLWPTTAMLSRVAVRDVDWNGTTVPASTQLLIVNAFNHFSHGPQGCPGAELALLAGSAMIAAVLARGVRLREPQLDPHKPLPHSLDYFALSFELGR